MTYQLIIFLSCEGEKTVNFSRMIRLSECPVIGRILEGLPTGPFRVEEEIGKNTSYAQSVSTLPEKRDEAIVFFRKNGWVRL